MENACRSVKSTKATHHAAIHVPRNVLMLLKVKAVFLLNVNPGKMIPFVDAKGVQSGVRMLHKKVNVLETVNNLEEM